MISALPHYKLFPNTTGSAVFGPGFQWIVGGVQFFTLVANGVLSSLDVEPHGGGAAVRRQTPQGLHVHFLTVPHQAFMAFDGLLGADLLDSFGADPIKDANRTRAYLAERV